MLKSNYVTFEQSMSIRVKSLRDLNVSDSGGSETHRQREKFGINKLARIIISGIERSTGAYAQSS